MHCAAFIAACAVDSQLRIKRKRYDWSFNLNSNMWTVFQHISS
jgi:hypothetical protein